MCIIIVCCSVGTFSEAHISPHSSVYEPKMIRLTKAGEIATMQALNVLSGYFVNEDAK